MTLEEKVEEIKKAVQSGVAKRRIDVKGNGVNMRKVLKGKKVSEQCIEEMYANLLKYRENPGASKVRREKYRNASPEVSQKEKVKAIRKAVKSGVKKNDLDPFGGGDAIRKLEKGKAVGLAKINEMYANLLSQKQWGTQTASPTKGKGRKKRVTMSGKQSPEKRPGKDNAPGSNATVEIPARGDEHVKNRALEQNEQIDALVQKVRILEEKVGELSGTVKPRTPLKVLGLTVTPKVDIVKGRKYRRWYAIYRENGTRRWIYIGKDVKKAEEKIQAWREKKRSSNEQSGRE